MKLHNVNMLTDENISPKVVRFLREHGVNVLDTKEQGWHGKHDEDLLNIAYQQQRFILTHDSDFGTLAINQEYPCYGILYLRLKNLKPQNVISVYQQVLSMDVDVFPGTILVIEEKRISIRHPSDLIL